ncbi:MAG: hypothetical protein ACLGRW_15855 [Acidobacteriota bacterium]|jgi:hypothetical protein
MANATQTAEADLGAGLSGNDTRRMAAQRRAGRERQKQILNLQKENILSQRTSNPGRRAALEAALAEIEAQLQAIG